MEGFECAKEYEVCNCTGMVEYGIYDDWNDRVYRVSSMKKVEGSVECKAENFENPPEIPELKKNWR